MANRDKSFRARAGAIASDLGDAARDRAEDALESAVDAVEHAVDAVEEGIEEAQKLMRRQMRDRPLAVAATAMGIGVLIGLAIANSARR